MIQSDIRNTVNLFFRLGDSLNLRANLNLDLPSTLPKTYIAPENGPSQEESILTTTNFRFHVNFPWCTRPTSSTLPMVFHHAPSNTWESLTIQACETFPVGRAQVCWATLRKKLLTPKPSTKRQSDMA